MCNNLTSVIPGFPCTALHSVMNQNARLSSLAKFKCGVVKILVATDVASRLGLNLIFGTLNAKFFSRFIELLLQCNYTKILFKC